VYIDPYVSIDLCVTCMYSGKASVIEGVVYVLLHSGPLSRMILVVRF